MRVGTSKGVMVGNATVRDHPHACGDKYTQYILNAQSYRIIPMRVGTSHKLSAAFFQGRDHPHACGDKTAIHRPSYPLLGSSPCVWGQVVIVEGCCTISRIIPMRVGTRHIVHIKINIRQDHPHACGDKRVQARSQTQAQGSSPCVWGQVSF